MTDEEMEIKSEPVVEDKWQLIVVPYESPALEFIEYIDAPFNEIPDYVTKIVALVQEWVLSEPCNIDDDDQRPAGPPHGLHDTPSVCLVKNDVLVLRTTPSQYKATNARPARLARVEAVAKVYETWFYTDERAREIAAIFNLITVPYARDTEVQRETKARLLALYMGIEGATTKRGFGWLASIRDFVRYWTTHT